MEESEALAEACAVRLDGPPDCLIPSVVIYHQHSKFE